MVISDIQLHAENFKVLLSMTGYRVVNATCSPSELAKQEICDVNTVSMLQDFFAMRSAAGIIEVTQDYADSSYSTVASSIGQTPLLIPRGDQNAHLQWLRTEGNGGLPLSNMYLGGEEQHFFKAVRALLKVV